MATVATTLNSPQTWAANVPLFAVCRILMITPLLLGAWADLYGLSAREVGFLASLELACFGLASLTAGLWISRVNPRVFFLAALTLIGIGDAVSFYLGSPDVLYALRAVLGLLAGAVAAVATALLARASNPTAAFGYNVAAQFGYGFVFFLALPPLMLDGGVLPLAIVLSLTTLLAVPLAAQAPSARIAKPARSGGPRQVPLAPLSILAATVLFFIVQLGLWAFIERLGVAVGHASVSVGQVLAISSLAGAPCALFIGQFERLTGLTVALACAGALQLGGLLLLFDASAFYAYAIGITTFSMGWAMIPPLAFGLLARTTTDSAITAMLPAAQTAGMAIGPAAMALLIRPGDFSLMINVSLALIVLVLVILLPLTRQRPH